MVIRQFRNFSPSRELVGAAFYFRNVNTEGVPVFPVEVSPGQSVVLTAAQDKKGYYGKTLMTISLWDMNYGRGTLASSSAVVAFSVVECECESDFIEILIAETFLCIKFVSV